MAPESQPVLPEIERILFRSELVTIGEFRCPREHPRFHDTGPIENHCFVFPRSSVTIEHEHARPIVTNATVVTIYNRGQRYRRGAISACGDRCDWFGVQEELARDVVRRFDPSVDERAEGPFALTHGRSDAALYLRQRRLFERAAAGAALDALAVEERVIELLESVLGRTHARPAPERTARGDATYHVERLLSARFGEDLKLADLAREVGLSVYHLSRTFRRETGLTLHQYRHQLRLRHGIEPLRHGSRSLAELALALGFSSHSHFSSAFRREFGLSPSEWRAAGTSAPRARQSRYVTANQRGGSRSRQLTRSKTASGFASRPSSEMHT